MDAFNPFYEAAVNHMSVQVNYLEELLGRKLTVDEKDNIYEFYSLLNPDVRSKFEASLGPLL